MKTQILNFRKTDHFLYRQWDRKIDDQLLSQVLQYVNCTKCKKDVVIAFPSFLKSLGIKTKPNECLILILSRNALVTYYWCNHPDYLYTKEKNAHFQILN
ncbi:MAG TPA: hypothetical protein VLZ72_06355 [Flavobacterium sp.]|nr:hypothetical protein [Flavobacterium sp.]